MSPSANPSRGRLYDPPQPPLVRPQQQLGDGPLEPARSLNGAQGLDGAHQGAALGDDAVAGSGAAMMIAHLGEFTDVGDPVSLKISQQAQGAFS